MALDLFAQPTVLAPPSSARVLGGRTYHTDEHGPLALDAYLPARGKGPFPAVLLVNGDGQEPVITRAKDWGVFRSYGEHLAGRGLIGVPFNHRSTLTVGRAGVAAEVDAVITYVRDHAAELRVDPERIGVWSFSAAGAFALAPLLRARPRYLRAVAGFYTVWDLAPMRGSVPSEEAIREWSATQALGSTAAGLPPIFVATAERDSKELVVGADLFVERARERGVDVREERHAGGQHAFDIRDDDDRSREIIREALDFFAEALR